MNEERIARLRAVFDGCIKYAPMLQDHGEQVADPRQHWTDEQCVAFARKWHAKAIEQLRASREGWNHGIPYCYNNPRVDFLAEANDGK